MAKVVDALKPWRGGLKKIAAGALACLILYAIIGFLVMPAVVRSLLATHLSERLHRDVAIQSVSINPFALTVRIREGSITEPIRNLPFVSFDELFVDLEAVSLLKGGPVVREIRLIGLHATVIRHEDLTYNFSDVIERLRQPNRKPFLFSFNNIQITEGSITFEDRPKQAGHHVSDLTLGVPFISNLPHSIEVFVHPAFKANIDGTPITLVGKTKPFSPSRETVVDVDIHQVSLPRYVEYFPAEVAFKLVTGMLDTQLSLSFLQTEGKPPALILSGQAEINRLAVTDGQDRPLLTLARLEIGIEAIDVSAKSASLTKLFLQSPDVHVRRDQHGTLNLQSLVPKKASKQVGPDRPSAASLESKETPLKVRLAEAQVTDGTITFIDDATERPLTTTLDTIAVAVHHFSTEPSQAAEVDISLKTGAGEMLKHHGTVSVGPLTAQGSVEMQRIALKRYKPYYGRSFLSTIEDGFLNVSAGYVYNGNDGGPITVSGLAGRLTALRLKQHGERDEFLKIPVLSVKDCALDLRKRSVVIGDLSSTNGRVVVKRERDGTLNLSRLLVPTASSPSWLIQVNQLVLDRYGVTLEDSVPSVPVTLVAEPLSMMITHTSTAKESKAKVLLRTTVNRTGAVSAEGWIGLRPLTANLNLSVEGLDVVPFQGYVADRIKIVATSGALSGKGSLTLSTGEDDQVAATFTGDASLTKLTTVDRTHAEDFLIWDSLYLGGIEAGNRPAHVQVQEVALTDFYSRLVVDADGTLNVQEAFHSAPRASEVAEAEAASTTVSGVESPAEPMKARIELVTLQGGRIDFSDRYIRPSFSGLLTDIGGKISGLSSEADQQADVRLQGSLDRTSPLEITGKINPLGKDLFVDLTLDFTDIELTRFTTYSAKYAGYTIEKGRLSLGLKYVIAKRKLDAQNSVTLKQLTFGEKVDSPEATTLPVRFAVSLLKDRQGQIKLNVPVSGSFDDPQFSVWEGIVKVCKNLLANAASTPFALIGALFGGGDSEELSYVEFEYGKADLMPVTETKLRKLAEVLYERPSLTLTLSAHVDVVKDREVLRQQQFARKLKVQKLNEAMKPTATSGSLETMTIGPDEYAKYLKMAYKQETFPKPRNLLGFAKDLDVPEMEKLMLIHIQVTEEDLRQLATHREQRVKDYLLDAKVEPDRMFLVGPQVDSGGKDKKESPLKDSRVDFVIKS
jgi:uncharacterized protein involved in outer membrane biogenesis